MAFLSLIEIFDIVLMTLVVGFIFQDTFVKLASDSKQAFLYSMIAVAPAIIFHEFGHKIIALSFGFVATFNAAYFWLFLGVALKFAAGMAFFIPAYVSFGCAGCTVTAGQSTLIAFAGPGINLLLYGGSILLLKYGSFSPRTSILIGATRSINGMLFLFNMLPIPLFDGFKVYQGLFHLLF
jgi:Zn-dependent protease